MLSSSNARLAAARRLTRRSARRETGRSLAEGAQAVREALAAEAVLELFATAEAIERHPELTTAATEISPVDAAKLSETVTPQGLVAVCARVDVAASANALSPYDLPATLGGLSARNGEDPGAVGVYGRGPTALIVVPLRGQIAGPLRDRIRESAAVQETAGGTYLPVGPIALLVTPRRFGPLGRGTSFLLAGTVTADVLQRAVTDLEAQVA